VFIKKSPFGALIQNRAGVGDPLLARRQLHDGLARLPPNYADKLKLTVTVSTKRSALPFKSSGE
jgi:hypothetical protein